MSKKAEKDQALRIAMLGHKTIPSREGGVEIVVGELSTRMVSKGHKVTCYNRRGKRADGAKNEKVNKKTEYEGVILKSVITLDKKGLAAMTSSFFAAIRAAFGRYDVVHFHAEGPCAMLWLPKLFGKKCVATVHGLDHQRAKWGKFASWYIRSGEKCAVKYADEIIVLSESVKNYFTETYGRETVLVPNGVNPVERVEAKEICDEYTLNKDEYILFLARLVPEKGVRYLIDAYKQVKTDKKLIIAGGSKDAEAFEAELHEMASDDERIIFTGFVEGRKLEELYSNAYVYVLPSDLEGMPLSLLEAMSYGNCCLTSDIPECAAVIQNKGVTFNQGSVDDLRDKLQMLCNNPETVAQYKATAADYICSRFNWNDVADRTLEIYREVQGKKKK